MLNISQNIYTSFIINKLKKENELLKNIIVKRYNNNNKILSIDEYELFLSLFEIKRKTTYPVLPESDIEE